MDGAQRHVHRRPVHAGPARDRVHVARHRIAGELPHGQPAHTGGQGQRGHGGDADALGDQRQDRSQPLELPRRRPGAAHVHEQPVHRQPRGLAVGGGHPRLVAQLPQVEGHVGVGQAVLARDDQHHGVAQQGEGAQALAVADAAVPVVDERDVHLARLHLAHPPPRPALSQPQRELGVTAQRARQRGRERHRRRREGAHHDPPGRCAGVRGEVGLGLLHHRQNALGVQDEPATGVGQLGAARRPVDERRAGFAFERDQLLRDGRRTVAERFCRRRDTSLPCELADQDQSPQFEHQTSLCLPTKSSACADAFIQPLWERDKHDRNSVRHPGGE